MRVAVTKRARYHGPSGRAIRIRHSLLLFFSFHVLFLFLSVFFSFANSYVAFAVAAIPAHTSTRRTRPFSSLLRRGGRRVGNYRNYGYVRYGSCDIRNIGLRVCIIYLYTYYNTSTGAGTWPPMYNTTIFDFSFRARRLARSPSCSYITSNSHPARRHLAHRPSRTDISNVRSHDRKKRNSNTTYR